jgi:hypothetical protein
MGYIVFSTITIGGFLFSYNFTEFSGPVECDFDAVDASAKSEALTLISGVTSVETCYDALPKIMNLINPNNDDMLDRCEDATFLNTLGNTKEYSMKYSHHVPHSFYKRRFEQIFNPLYE